MESMAFFWKISVSKLAKILTCRAVVSARGILSCGIGAEINQFFIKNNLRRPFVYRAGNTVMPGYAFVARSIILPFLPIMLILISRTISQILAAIVKPVAISVVCFYPLRSIHNNPMHLSFFSIGESAFFPCGIKRVSVFFGLPLPLVEKLKIFVINQCRFALREFYFLHCIFSNTKHLLNVQLSRLAHGARNIQQVPTNYKAKSAPYQSRRFDYSTNVSLESVLL